MTGSLTIVGTGMRLSGQVTPESKVHIQAADKVFFLDPEPITCDWIRALNPNAESLIDCYGDGRPRLRTYAEMVDRILAPLREGARVCAAFYGHPGVFVRPSHEAIRRAREEGIPARMLPGISSLDCLYADLGVDPGRDGSQTFEATDFLVYRRQFDPHCQLILLQVGGVGVSTWKPGRFWSAEGLQILVDELLETYPAEHVVTVYETFSLPVCEPLLQRVPLSTVPSADITVNSTLYVPPFGPARRDTGMLRRLGLDEANLAARDARP